MAMVTKRRLLRAGSIAFWVGGSLSIALTLGIARLLTTYALIGAVFIVGIVVHLLRARKRPDNTGNGPGAG
ncbi:hypothetical protein [Dactylosporangium sp. CA-233914]|uniref:hypothetical protein n=1 Tax=Dactylosporangium sp. CA-233914 TaxID=3239934 RepID=UPI003D94FDF0